MNPPRDDDPPSSDDGSEETDRNPGGSEETDRTPGGSEETDRTPGGSEETDRSQDGPESDGSTGDGPVDRDSKTGDGPHRNTGTASDDARPRPGRADGPPSQQPPPAEGGATRRSGPAESRDRPTAPPPQQTDDWEEEDDWVTTFAVDIASSALAVLLVGFFLFTISGVWPPMVAVESASMDPHMKTGDLVFVMEEDRFSGAGAHGETGVVTAQSGGESGFEKFSQPGDVIVYEPNGNGDQTPIIHRAMFWVEEDERWFDRADKTAVGTADSCEDLANCPAPYAGFITKGDANSAYDQAGPNPHSGPVKPEWIVGTAEQRIPALGCIRLRSQECSLGLSTLPPVGAPTDGIQQVIPSVSLPSVGFDFEFSAVFAAAPSVPLGSGISDAAGDTPVLRAAEFSPAEVPVAPGLF